MTRLTRLVTAPVRRTPRSRGLRVERHRRRARCADAIKSFATVPGTTQAGGHPDI